MVHEKWFRFYSSLHNISIKYDFSFESKRQNLNIFAYSNGMQNLRAQHFDENIYCEYFYDYFHANQ